MIEIEINIEDLDARLTSLIALGRDLTPVNRGIAGILADIPERAFREQADPATGEAWAALSPVTVKRRGSATPILQVSGQLAGSMQSEYSRDFSRVYTNKEYATTMFYGAKQGEFGRTKRNGPIPWGDIPGRRFFGISKQDEDDLVDFVRNAVQAALSG